jgi:uncharacterized protein YgiM (DUF1202 family)|tara:strand:+ start:113 stop:424 length:312 start_codon:yes stop_codon:yes gene_type:complete
MKRLLLTLLVCGFIIAAGCTENAKPAIQVNGQSAISQAALTHVVTTDTVYYMSGPQQARPPEGKFKAGTKVTLVQKAGSYSVVRSAGGVQAYVSTASLKAIEK